MSRIFAVIGGSGLYGLAQEGECHTHLVDTPFGSPSSPIQEITYLGQKIFFLARHGSNHQVPPHKVNYRANIWALNSLGVNSIIAVNSVGALDVNLQPGTLLLPDQLIDYSWGRVNSFYDDDFSFDKHVDFTWPFDTQLKDELTALANAAGIEHEQSGCIAVTQGPRLETAAEVRKYIADGCTLVGMTSMPEAVLARELGLAYACIALVVNAAAGLSEGEISLQQIENALDQGMGRVKNWLEAIFASPA